MASGQPGLGLVLETMFVVSTAAGLSALIGQSLSWLALMNLLLAGFNLLPGSPLDGGSMLRAILRIRYDDVRRAGRVAAGVGRLLGLLVILIGFVDLMYADLAGGAWTLLAGRFLLASSRLPGATGSVAARGPRSDGPSKTSTT